ncbi:hypothetical protein [Sphingobacterium siyangense]|uniref:Uncharacterized protein n=1 Tax=Sphingobacterium siyangense TaxID=459529 RepID=A0A562MK84_9SPHI|nr:hypothetical protein [Sphingobacterium siyangense]TWI20324.1 hypothetical protein IQ31_02279 [Sphingobacterium siyangense]
MKRELPILNIEGTDFLVDVKKFELREKGNPKNFIGLEDMRDLGDGYTFLFSQESKNLPSFRGRLESITVKIPEFVVLDPAGMAEKYKLKPDELAGKTDFDLMVDQKAVDLRVNNGLLPTINIAGHSFYVDIRMDMLRPKDDFLSSGIRFSEIDNFYDEIRNAYFIPYDPKKHEYREIDYETIKEIPKDLIVVSFPTAKTLDPIGWNRHHGFDALDGLKETGLKSHSKAKTATWDDISVPLVIKENLERERKVQNNKPDIKSVEAKQKNTKGRKM